MKKIILILNFVFAISVNAESWPEGDFKILNTNAHVNDSQMSETQKNKAQKNNSQVNDKLNHKKSESDVVQFWNFQKEFTKKENLSQIGSVFIFLSSKCPCSNSHIQAISQLSQDFKNFNFVGVHSNLNETTQEAQNYFEELKLHFYVIRDQKQIWAEYFKAYKTPHAVVLDENKNIVYQGGASSSVHYDETKEFYLKNILLDLTQNKPPRYKEKRSLGCVIVREKE